MRVGEAWTVLVEWHSRGSLAVTLNPWERLVEHGFSLACRQGWCQAFGVYSGGLTAVWGGWGLTWGVGLGMMAGYSPGFESEGGFR